MKEESATSTFPQIHFNRKKDVATFFLTARNGFRHRVKVPAVALPLLKKAFPFECTGSRGKKTLTKNGVNLAKVWVAYFLRLVDCTVPYKVRCKNSNWLDWTIGNIFPEFDDVQAKQQTFEDQTSYQRRLISNKGREILLARYAENFYSTSYVNASPEVREIFAEAQKLAGYPSRPSGYGFDSEKPSDD